MISTVATCFTTAGELFDALPTRHGSMHVKIAMRAFLSINDPPTGRAHPERDGSDLLRYARLHRINLIPILICTGFDKNVVLPASGRIENPYEPIKSHCLSAINA